MIQSDKNKQFQPPRLHFLVIQCDFDAPVVTFSPPTGDLWDDSRGRSPPVGPPFVLVHPALKECVGEAEMIEGFARDVRELANRVRELRKLAKLFPGECCHPFYCHRGSDILMIWFLVCALPKREREREKKRKKRKKKSGWTHCCSASGTMPLGKGAKRESRCWKIFKREKETHQTYLQSPGMALCCGV